MLEYTGKYGHAKVMIDEIDKATVGQIYEFLNHKAFTNQIILMPDLHYGSGVVIGFTMEMPDMIIPNIVGVDINCGMLVMNMGTSIFSKLSRSGFDTMVRRLIPFGKAVKQKPNLICLQNKDFTNITVNGSIFTTMFNDRYNTKYEPIIYSKEWFEKKCKQIGMDYDRALKSIGTLGGGNHFIEVGKSVETKDYLVTVHSGSRQFGLKIANYWQRKAGRGNLAYLQGDDMFGYLSDMYFAQAYASINRKTMGNIISQDIINDDVVEAIETCHNFIDFRDFIIRKGAISSYENEKMIIPFNMEDGILICEGKSNEDWNKSAPHGAGRVGPRSKAKKEFKRIEEDIKHRMKQKNIYCSKLPLDEVKEAYKDPKLIEAAIEPTAKIIDRIIPVLAMKD